MRVPPSGCPSPPNGIGINYLPWRKLPRLRIAPHAFAPPPPCAPSPHRHIVLAVYHAPSRKWGALGLSRRPQLMDKELAYDSLAGEGGG